MNNKYILTIAITVVSFFCLSCSNKSAKKDDIVNSKIVAVSANQSDEHQSYYGTLEPFASEAIYFLMTDRFVDGDPLNNHVSQGGKNSTFERALIADDGRKAYVGYMGGDFKGITNNAKYISDMGFSAIWLSPVVDQPDEAFTGGEPIEFGGAFKDGGKTGYHGYWGINFFKLDEHWPSENLDFKSLVKILKEDYQIKTVLDIVLNHGAPAFSMQEQHSQYGKLFDKEGRLIADHQNLNPEQLDDNNPLHAFYNQEKDIAQLSDFNQDNPQVLNYFVEAYLYWIEQGAAAFRIDTVKHMPHEFWKKFTDRIRAKHPEFFMFAESYSFEPDFLAQHTLDKNGGISVLDFAGRKYMTQVFENPVSDYSELLSYLYLEQSPYKDVYELATFYDNHDMSRMNTDVNGFIDAHNWLFTSRGIPVVYYGSEIAFMAGSKEHEGNRNYFGQENIEKAKQHPIHKNLTRIANIRKQSIALQRGLQVNLDFKGQQAAFYRIFEHEGTNQTALVLLNKGDSAHTFAINKYLSSGVWVDAVSNKSIEIDSATDPRKELKRRVPAHSVAVLLLNQGNNNVELIQLLKNRMQLE